MAVGLFLLGLAFKLAISAAVAFPIMLLLGALNTVPGLEFIPSLSYLAVLGVLLLIQLVQIGLTASISFNLDKGKQR